VKFLKAYVRTFKADEVVAALKELKAQRLTAIDVKALGDEIDPTDLKVSAELGSSYTTMVKIEMICSDDCAAKVRDTILQHARTGYKGDGLIAISPVEEAVSIRTGRAESWAAEDD
jgi:nitrogen regulatory protein P-II 1